jgi:hypothetical protein
MLDVVRGVHLILHFGQQRHGNEHIAMDLGRLYLVASRDRPKSLLAIDSPQKMCQKCGVRSSPRIPQPANTTASTNSHCPSFLQIHNNFPIAGSSTMTINLPQPSLRYKSIGSSHRNEPQVPARLSPLLTCSIEQLPDWLLLSCHTLPRCQHTPMHHKQIQCEQSRSLDGGATNWR